jgi:hypothetical protein
MKAIVACSAILVFCSLAISKSADSSSMRDTVAVQRSAPAAQAAPTEEIVEPQRNSNIQSVENPQKFEYSCGEIQRKIASFSRVRNVGIGLLSGGVAAAAIGLGMIVSANGVTYYSYDSEYGESGNMTGAIGSEIAAVGIIMAVAGGVLTTIGVKKVVEYKNRGKQQRCTLEVELSPNALALVCRF